MEAALEMPTPRKKHQEIAVEDLLPQTIFAGKHLPYGSFHGTVRGFDFMDATIGFLPFGENELELEHLKQINLLIGQSCNAKNPLDLKNVARGILTKETSIDLSNYKLHTSLTGARGALIPWLTALVNQDEKRNRIAYASPNWGFDSIISKVPNAVHAPFYAFSADSFVDSFSKLKDLDSVASLIIVDPANPLGYRLGKEEVSALESITDKHGVRLVFDDVFRGMQAQGERHGASEYSKNGIIVETTSKRFGVRGLGVTWTLVPNNLNLGLVDSVVNSECEGCSNIASAVTNGLYETKYGEKIRRHLILNANAFFNGVLFSSNEGENLGAIDLAFGGMPFVVYRLPSGKYPKMNELHLTLRDKIGVTSGFDWISKIPEYTPSDDEIKLASSYVRICPTKETPDRSFYAGVALATIVRNAVIR